VQKSTETTRIDPSRWRKADDLLAAALERPPFERRPFVEARGEDPATVAMVLSLLELEPQVPAYLDGEAFEHALPFLAALPEESAGSLGPGDRVGAYRLVEEIGRGGMGVVYLAERADGRFQKRVAIKIIPALPCPMPAHFGGRFQSEREILAQLEHPAIARLLDGGETERGEPYLVMEYVEGERIDAYCDRRRFSVEQRIALFLDAGEAVAYAHQNLVVHRDIKPSNVLVSAAGEVKLLDFGIAKVLSVGSEAASSHTVTRERTMTPAYASPEQVRGDPIRTVSDVYSLGVLLYELLTGCRPYRTGGLPHEIATAILDQEPARPSVAVGRVPASQPRASDQDRLGRLLHGDLDAIVLKALRKAPDRRYQSVEALLDDLRRHLAGAPVSARAGDGWYRVSRFARRHWVALAAAAMLLLVGGALATFHARRIQGERDVARREAATAQAVTGFVASLFEASNAWEASQTRTDALTARALLEQGTQRIRTELAGQPEVRAELLSTLGSIHSSLGQGPRAEALLGEALALRRRLQGPDSKAVAGDLDRLALVYYRKGDYARAESLNREAYDIRRRRFGPRSEEAAGSLGKIAMDLRKKGDTVESERLFRASLGILRDLHGDEHRDVAAALKGLAMIRRERGDLVEAERFARQGLAISERLLGDRDPLTTEHRSDLATILRTKGDLDGAETLFRRALEDSRQWFGDEHPNVAIRWNGLALTLHEKGDLAGAEPAYRESLRLNQKFWGVEHPAIATGLNNLAAVLQDKGDLPGAETLFHQALEMRRKVLRPEHPDIAVSTANIAQVALDRNELPRAAELFQQALAALRAHAPDHLKLPAVHIGLGRTLVRLGRPEEAEPLLRQGCQILEKTLRGGADTHPAMAVCRAAWGQSLLALGRRREAERLIAQADRVPQSRPGDRRFVEAVAGELGVRTAHAR
jgi:serine/threonine-protein kinase